MTKLESFLKKIGDRRSILRAVYLLLLAGIAWQSMGVFRALTKAPSVGPIRKVEVWVRGNVERPGKYTVAEGTTNFEILRVAGIRTTSDLTPFNLSGQVGSGEEIEVGQLDQEVGLTHGARLEFFLGEVGITTSRGIDKTAQEGIAIDAGDRVRTGDRSQAEISLGAYSRLDLDSYSEVSFDKINIRENDREVTEVFQKAGFCWYRVVYSQQSELVKIVTPLCAISIAGKGAEFNIEVKYTEVIIDVHDGLALIERGKGDEVLNAVGGQRITVYDDNRPFAVSKVVAERSNQQRFSDLGKAKAANLIKNLPLNFLFCTVPNAYHLISVRFDQQKIFAVRIPGKTAVSDFAQGFNTMEEAFLYGGTVYATAIIERLLNLRVPKYVVFEKDDMVRSASIIGGVNVKLDANAASQIGQQGAGAASLSGQQLIDFMKPSNAGSSDETERRQMVVLKALFEGLKSRSVVLTTMKVGQVMSGLESNMVTAEVMGHYKNFMTNSNSWKFVNLNLPTERTYTGRKTLEQPDLEKSRNLLANAAGEGD